MANSQLKVAKADFIRIMKIIPTFGQFWLLGQLCNCYGPPHLPCASLLTCELPECDRVVVVCLGHMEIQVISVFTSLFEDRN